MGGLNRVIAPILALLEMFMFMQTGAAQGPPLPPKTFTSSELGFSYSPPQDGRDLTKYEEELLRQRAAANHSTNTSTILLAVVSGPEDKAANWYSVGIQSYPREKLSGLTDHDACETYSRRVAGVGHQTANQTGRPVDMQIGGADFVVSAFGLSEPPLDKQARVYTTIRRGQMIGLSFTANSAGVLDRIVQTMKTFRLQ